MACVRESSAGNKLSLHSDKEAAPTVAYCVPKMIRGSVLTTEGGLTCPARRCRRCYAACTTLANRGWTTTGRRHRVRTQLERWITMSTDTRWFAK